MNFMNKKLNKKGFTLIEMLVVIAIIAILVAIIIPVVGGSSDKAKAATNAANLRSVKAEILTKYLSGVENINASEIAGKAKFYHVGESSGGFTTTGTLGQDNYKVLWDGHDILYWAGEAGESGVSGS